MRKNYVTFYSPGTLFAEIRTVPIEQWDPTVAVGMSNDVEERYGARPYAFQFSTYLEVDPVPDGEGGYADAGPKRLTTTGMYYIGGRVDTYDDIRHREDPSDLILLSNMRGNGFWIAVTNERTWRVTHPFEPKDFLVHPETGVVIESGDSDRLATYRTYMADRFKSTSVTPG